MFDIKGSQCLCNFCTQGLHRRGTVVVVVRQQYLTRHIKGILRLYLYSPLDDRRLLRTCRVDFYSDHTSCCASMPDKHYIIYADESDKKGRYYSNFFGGVILAASDQEQISAELQKFKDDLGLAHELKWQNVDQSCVDRYPSGR